MMSHGSAISKDEAAQCRALIDKFRENYSWNQLAGMLRISRMPSFHEGNGPIGQVLKDFYHGAPSLELLRACEQLDKRLNRPRKMETAVEAKAAAAIREQVIGYVTSSPGISRGWLAKHIKSGAGQAAIRSVIQQLISEGVIKDKYTYPARKSELRMNTNGHHVVPAPVANEQYVARPPVPHANVMDEPEPAASIPTPPPAPPPLNTAAPTWDSIRAKLFSAADDIKQMGKGVASQTGLPKAMTDEVEAMFCRRHDKLLKFIEEELE